MDFAIVTPDNPTRQSAFSGERPCFLNRHSRWAEQELMRSITGRIKTPLRNLSLPSEEFDGTGQTNSTIGRPREHVFKLTLKAEGCRPRHAEGPGRARSVDRYAHRNLEVSAAKNQPPAFNFFISSCHAFMEATRLVLRSPLMA